MKMKATIDRQILDSINVLNTLNGGVVEPVVELNQFADHRQIRALVPGFSPEALRVEIHNNFLMIFYTHQFPGEEVEISVPRFVYHKAIPYFIDRQNIHASVENEVLVVKLPFNELANGYHRTISVGQE